MKVSLQKVSVKRATVNKQVRSIGGTRRAWLLTMVPMFVFLLLAASGCGSSGEEPSASSSSTTTLAGESATSTTVASQAGYSTVDVQTAYDQLSANADAQLVDVREPDEWESTGVPPGALLIPLGEIEQRALAEVAKDRPVYVICRTGNRSRTASEALIGLGYTEVYNVDGGITAWRDAGLPVEPYQR
jgi:phage shock protein E